MSDELQARIERFRGMAERFPTSELPWFSLGQAHFEAGGWEAAAEAFGRASALRPDYMMAFLLQGEALLRLERFEEARAAVLEALALARAQGHSGPVGDCEHLLRGIEAELE